MLFLGQFKVMEMLGLTTYGSVRDGSFGRMLGAFDQDAILTVVRAWVVTSARSTQLSLWVRTGDQIVKALVLST